MDRRRETRGETEGAVLLRPAGAVPHRIVRSRDESISAEINLRSTARCRKNAWSVRSRCGFWMVRSIA